MSTEGFDSEAFKLMIEDISKTRETSPNVYQLRLSSKDLQLDPDLGSKVLTIKLVWIQGSIVDMREEGSGEKVIVIQDGTGEAVVAGCHDIPGGNHEDVKPGAYIGILGIITSISPHVYIKAVKIMVLTSKPNLKAIWPDEVKDLKAFLLGHYSSWNENVG